MSEDQPKPVSLTRRPVFRWAVAVYFAVLLGGGTFVLPAEFHMRIGEAAGVGALTGAGLGAKLLLAGLAAAIGFLIGFFIGGRITARARAASDEEAWFDDSAPPALPYIGAEADAEMPGEVIDERTLGDDGADHATETETAGQRLFNPRDHMAADETDPAPPSPEPVDADFHEIEEGNASGVTTDEFAASRSTEALGDLSLADLTARLATALEASKAARPNSTSTNESDPVVAFLRREADRPTTDGEEPTSQGSVQASLRSALDRLSQVSKGN